MSSSRSICPRTQSAALALRRNFVVGPSYDQPIVEINTIPARVIDIAARQKSSGFVWMDYGQEVLQVATYDGNGLVCLGTDIAGPKASPESLLVYAESIYPTMRVTSTPAVPVAGIASFYRPDPAFRGPVVPLEVSDDRMEALLLSNRMILSYQNSDHLSSSELVDQTLHLLKTKPEGCGGWEARVAARIQALGDALRFYEGTVRQGVNNVDESAPGTPAAA